MLKRETASPTSSGARTPTKSFADLRPITPTSQSGSFTDSGSFAASRPGTPAATASSFSAARSASPSRGDSSTDKSNPYLHYSIQQPAADAPRHGRPGALTGALPAARPAAMRPGMSSCSRRLKFCTPVQIARMRMFADARV